MTGGLLMVPTGLVAVNVSVAHSPDKKVVIK